MKDEFKRTMKLMWGHSGKMRLACGCSILFIVFVCIFGFVGELFFWEKIDLRYRPDRPLDGYDYGIYSCMSFLFLTVYGNAKMVQGAIGKWIFGSKLGKSVLVKGLMVNRLILFGGLFLPCLISRIVLVCRGYAEDARLGLFLVAWGAVYLISCVTCVSVVAFVLLMVIYIVSSVWDKFWGFAGWIQVSVPVAGMIFVLCLIVGTVAAKMVLEAAYRKRVCRPQPLLQVEVNGR